MWTGRLRDRTVDAPANSRNANHPRKAQCFFFLILAFTTNHDPKIPPFISKDVAFTGENGSPSLNLPNPMFLTPSRTLVLFFP